jgi:hypothetical protein
VLSNGDTNPTIYFRLKNKFSFPGDTSAKDLVPAPTHASPKGDKAS